MPRGIKIFLIIVVVIGIGILSLCIWGYRTVTGSIPQTSGDLVLSGLEKPVRVFRDGYHIPHIYADTEHDLLMAQGFVTAQDRFWQMDFLRRTANGQLSEIFGSATVETDSMIQVMGFARLATEFLPQLSENSNRILAAYTEGVNAYISDQMEKLPVEFALLNYKPDPWTIKDCLAIQRLFAWQTNTEWFKELIAQGFMLNLGISQSKQLLPGGLFNSLEIKTSHLLNVEPIIQNLIDFWEKRSSNRPVHGGVTWVIDGEKSETDTPILATNHVYSMDTPCMWYEVHLVGGGLDVTGLSHPGLPLVFSGFNRDIAWGLSFPEANTVDLIPYKFVESEQTIESKIGIKFLDPKPISIRTTVKGPVLKSEGAGTHSMIILNWTGYQFSDDLSAIYHINKSRNWIDFQHAVEEAKVPFIEATYADRQGNIGIHSAGRTFDAVDHKGSEYNPSSGFLVSGISNPSQTTEFGKQADIISGCIDSAKSVSIHDMKQLQSSIQVKHQHDFLEVIMPYLNEDARLDSLEQVVLEKLNSWDGMMRPGSMEALAFETMVYWYMKAIFEDQLDKSLFRLLTRFPSMAIQIVKRALADGGKLWLGSKSVVQSTSDAPHPILQVYKTAVDALEEKHGHVARWSWGEHHTVFFEHPLGQHPLLSQAFNMGPFHVGGSSASIQTMGYDTENPFQVTWGVVARQLVDLSDLDNSASILTTGQSGQPLDEHYRSQLPLYFGNLYHPILTDTMKITQSGWECLQLNPEESKR